MKESNPRNNKSPGKVVFLIILLLTVLPLVLFILVQFAPPREKEPSPAGTADGTASAHSTAAERRARRAEDRAVRQEVKTTHAASVPHGMAPDPEMTDFIPAEDISVVGAGAVVPDAPRTKRATPYPPGTVPGDSGVVVQYAGSPQDMTGAPPPPPQDDLWGGRTPTPIPPANMRGIGGGRRIDPNDPFFQQELPNPFDR